MPTATIPAVGTITPRHDHDHAPTEPAQAPDVHHQRQRRSHHQPRRRATGGGFAAYSRDEPRVTMVALQQVVHSGQPEMAPMAARNLGVLLWEQGDVAGAQAAFQRALDSGHPDQAPAALQALRQLGQQ